VSERVEPSSRQIDHCTVLAHQLQFAIHFIIAQVPAQRRSL
jgi:hypothetical protein